jgi:hypothetical protein
LVVTGFASEQDVYAHLKAVKSARLPRLAGHVARRPEAGPQLRPGSGDRHERLSSLVWQGPMPQGAELSGQLLDECCVAALGSAPLEQVTFRLLWMPSHTGAALQAPDWAQLLAGKWGREKPSAALSAATGLHPGRELYLALTATGPAADARSGRR